MRDLTTCDRCGQGNDQSATSCSSCGSPISQPFAAARPATEASEHPSVARTGVSLAKSTEPPPSPTLAAVTLSKSSLAAVSLSKSSTSREEVGDSRDPWQGGSASALNAGPGPDSVNRRRRRFLPWIGFVLSLAVVGCAALVAAHPFSSGPTASELRPASDQPSSSQAAGSAVASAGTSADTVAFSAPLSRRERRSLLLTPSELTDIGLSSDSGAGIVTLTPRDYADSYRHQSISPARCDGAKGLLVFADASSGPASIERTNDLVVAGSDTNGSQQVRQFATEDDAIAFMEEQKTWFGECSQALFATGPSRIAFTGAVDVDSSPDMLLASADDVGARWSSEFDGWVREGTVVYAAYLLGGGGTSVSDLRRAGAALIEKAAARLRSSR